MRCPIINYNCNFIINNILQEVDIMAVKPPDSIINTYIYLIENGRKKLEDIKADVRPYVEAALRAKQEAAAGPAE